MSFKNSKFIYIVFLCVVISCTKKPIKSLNFLTKPSTPEVKEETVLKLGENTFTKTEVQTSLENLTSLDSSSTDAVLKELIQKSLFVAEAKALGNDTSQNFKEQVASNVKLALQDILEDKVAIKKLEDEAFQRYQSEVNASHIFIPISPYASAADTTKLYADLMQVRAASLKNNDFETQAKRWSKDPKTAQQGGSLGWFSVFYLVYPLESAIYSTPVDSISKPIRSSSGYHLVKVNNIRKNSGTVKIQHIYKYIPKEMTDAEVTKLTTQLDSIRVEIERGAKFEDMVNKYSDDFNSRENNGELPVFGIGTRMESSFEEAAFALKKGEVSTPIRSSNGLHLIKLIEKYKPDTKNTFLEANKSKIVTDSRAEFLQAKRIEELKKTYKVTVQNETLNQALKFSGIKILNRSWEKPVSVILKDELFKINDKSYTVSEYFDYIIERQEFEKWGAENPSEIFSMLYNKFLNSKLLKYQEEEALKNNANVQRWSKALVENILYSDFYDKKILEKSLTDTVGQRQFYERNKQLFTPNELGNISVMRFTNENAYNDFKTLAASPKPYKLYRGIRGLYYDANEYKLTSADERKLIGLIEILNENPGFIVEIGGHTDSKEEPLTSELRIKEVVSFLVKNGVPLKRISEVNYRNSVVHDRFDWSKNQVVTFQFFSNLESDLAKTFNTKNDNAITFDTFTITKNEFETRFKSSWSSKNGVLKTKGVVETYDLKVKKTKGSYKDFKSDVIIKYQEYLTNELVKSLANKYKVDYNSTEINSLINDLKKR